MITDKEAYKLIKCSQIPRTEEDKQAVIVLLQKLLNMLNLYQYPIYRYGMYFLIVFPLFSILVSLATGEWRVHHLLFNVIFVVFVISLNEFYRKRFIKYRLFMTKLKASTPKQEDKV